MADKISHRLLHWGVGYAPTVTVYQSWFSYSAVVFDALCRPAAQQGV